MIAGQTMRATDGYQIALFPLEYMNISQGELTGSNMSHYNTFNMDFLGWDENGRLNDCPLYAPCDLYVVSLWDYQNTHTVTFESADKVHLANGDLDYLTIEFTHSNNPPYNTIGDFIPMGTFVYTTGVMGYTTGDHVHMCCGEGHFDGYTQRTGGHYDLTNRIHIYDALYINDTIIIDDWDYDWKFWTYPLEGTRKKSHFPWVLYSNKLRKNV